MSDACWSARFSGPFLALALLALAGCAAGIPEPVGAPAADPAAVEERLVRATTPASARQVTFGWELDEAGARVRGRGVVREEAPERLRLDLFGPRGESYLAAALVGGEFRVPPAIAGRVPLPSPALLWGALGVIRPPADARLLGATVSGDTATLRYQTAGEEVLEYVAHGSRLRDLRRRGRSGVRESITLSHSPEGELRRAEYRDPGAYRTLVLNVETIANVGAFPESTWRPAGTGR